MSTCKKLLPHRCGGVGVRVRAGRGRADSVGNGRHRAPSRQQRSHASAVVGWSPLWLPAAIVADGGRAPGSASASAWWSAASSPTRPIGRGRATTTTTMPMTAPTTIRPAYSGDPRIGLRPELPLVRVEYGPLHDLFRREAALPLPEVAPEVALSYASAVLFARAVAPLRLAQRFGSTLREPATVLSALWPCAGGLPIMVNDSLTTVLALEASCLA